MNISKMDKKTSLISDAADLGMEIEENETGQVVIYTNVYQWKDSSYNDHPEKERLTGRGTKSLSNARKR